MSKPVLVIDNYDSFVYNLVQFIQQLDVSVEVQRNDSVDVGRIRAGEFGAVLISPGPGHPTDAGQCLEVIEECATLSLPLFGVCLGHQAIGQAFGAAVVRAPELVHGRASTLDHDGGGLFAGVSPDVQIGRYHSLIVSTDNLPKCLSVDGTTGGLIMAMHHESLPMWGVQFHPESVLTASGHRMIANWLNMAGYAVDLDLVDRLVSEMDAVRHALPRA